MEINSFSSLLLSTVHTKTCRHVAVRQQFSVLMLLVWWHQISITNGSFSGNPDSLRIDLGPLHGKLIHF